MRRGLAWILIKVVDPEHEEKPCHYKLTYVHPRS